MMWWYSMVPVYYTPMYYAPMLGERVAQHRQIEDIQDIQPYLQTWPYSNTYYGNYYES